MAQTNDAGRADNDDTAVAWLSSTEQRAWRSLIQLIMRLPPALETDLHAHSRLTVFEYLVLSGLSEAPQRTMRLSDLAAVANSSLSRLSHVVSRLETRGWVQRRTCDGDGRSTEAVLTEPGWQVIYAAAPGHVRMVRSTVIDALSSDQLRQLNTIAEAIMQAVPPN